MSEPKKNIEENELIFEELKKNSEELKKAEKAIEEGKGTGADLKFFEDKIRDLTEQRQRLVERQKNLSN